jgi:hemoglobin
MTDAAVQEPQAAPPRTPFDILGGRSAVAAFVERFYDLMEGDPAYAELRALHAPDLGPMRRSLTGFLTAWLGGPRDWFDERPGACVMSAHAGVKITPASAEQWKTAMARALADSGVTPELAAQINAAFARMSQGMAMMAASRG